MPIPLTLAACNPVPAAANPTDEEQARSNRAILAETVGQYLKYHEAFIAQLRDSLAAVGGNSIVFLVGNALTLTDSDNGKTYVITNGGGIDFDLSFTTTTNPASPFRTYLFFLNPVMDLVVHFQAGMTWQFFDSSSSGAGAPRRTFTGSSCSFVVTHIHPSGLADAWTVQQMPTDVIGTRSDLMLGGQAEVRLTTILDGAGGAMPATYADAIRITVNGVNRKILLI